MTDTIRCGAHGESSWALVCPHLVGEVAGLGFNSDQPRAENQHPDAWCDDCELIRAAHGAWTDEARKLVKMSQLCEKCYERARVRNTRTAVALSDLANFRWKCSSCEEWHTGPLLDYSFSEPLYWDARRHKPRGKDTFLNSDYCVIDGEQYYVRGIILLPIIGTLKHLCFGVWGSLSKKNFDALIERDQNPERSDLPPMFSWLSNRFADYSDTVNIKMYAHVQPGKERPHFELEPTDHPLALEYHHGVSAERVKELMNGRVREIGRV